MGFNFSYKDLIFDSYGLSETIKANLSLCLTDLSWLFIFMSATSYVCIVQP